MTHVILGYGEIGQLIKQLINSDKVACFDKGEWENIKLQEIDILHICIRYTNAFVNIAREASKIFNPKVVIIHSTVKENTTAMVRNAIYSPVLGRHGDGFLDSTKKYIKFFAGDENLYHLIKNQFIIKCEYWGINSSELEFAKVMSTNYMYWNLIFNKLLYNDCKQNNYDFEKVYKKWNENYNQGISKIHDNWQRPIYDYDKERLPGGHCLRENIHLTDNFICDLLKAWDKGKLSILKLI